MNFSNICISCLMVATILISSVQSSNSIHSTARIGDFTKISDNNVTIKAGSNIGSFAKIGSHSVISENSIIGEYADISERCLLGKNIKVDNFARISAQTTIEDESRIGQFAEIGEKTSIATKVLIDQYANVGNNNQIGMGCTLAPHSSTGTDVKIDEKAIMDQHAEFNGEHIDKRGYVGQFCHVESKVNIGELAVVHEYVRLKSDTKVKTTEIYIRTPTSTILYQQCARDISSDEANIAKPTGETISSEFNKRLGELIAMSMDQLRNSCSQSNRYKSSPPNLPKIVSLYLIQYHGYDRFKEYSGYSLSPSTQKMLDNEHHFKDSAKTILTSDVQEKFIQLLTIDLDAKRQLRVEGDEFCDMFNKIKNKDRSILLAGSSSSSNRNIIHSMMLLTTVLINLKIFY